MVVSTIGDIIDVRIFRTILCLDEVFCKVFTWIIMW